MNVTDNACTMDSGVASTFDHIQDNSTRHNLSHFLRLHDLYTSCYTNFKLKLRCPSIREIKIWYSFTVSLSQSVTLISFIVARKFPTWQMLEYNWINSVYGMGFTPPDFYCRTPWMHIKECEALILTCSIQRDT